MYLFYYCDVQACPQFICSAFSSAPTKMWKINLYFYISSCLIEPSQPLRIVFLWDFHLHLAPKSVATSIALLFPAYFLQLCEKHSWWQALIDERVAAHYKHTFVCGSFTSLLNIFELFCLLPLLLLLLLLLITITYIYIYF